MEDPLPPVADWRRERDVFDLYAAFQDIPTINNLGSSPVSHSFPGDFVPKPASDASLAAFAQLAAMRLHAQRSMISLLDGQYQYILAEATPNTSLRFNSISHRNPDILLGNVRIPRNWGLCERVLDPLALADGDAGIIIIPDLSQSPEHADRTYVKEGPQFRFYAGVPIRSNNGMVVGSMCIFDGPERGGMSQDDIFYLQDLAATVMEYLVTYTLKDQHRRGAEGLHGLLAFTEGDTKLLASKEQYNPRVASPKLELKEDGFKSKQEPLESNEEVLVDVVQSTLGSAPLTPSTSERRNSVGDLQDKILPNTHKELFARAAGVMRRSNDMDGVMFLDASIAATGFDGDQSPGRANKQCQVLGFAMRDRSSFTGNSMPHDMVPSESNFSWLLKQYPHGYSLDCDEAAPHSGSGSVDGGPLPEPLAPIDSTRDGQGDQKEHVLRVKALFPNIKSALFLPFWDYERNRWFAGCFCWSMRAERNLGGPDPMELPFLKAFGHSIMQEVARLDAMNTSQVKTTFLSSLSHELRSPLHGILGSIQLMRTTSLDSFQSSMVDSINICGRTLLETVQHLLDHAERKEPSHNYSNKTFPDQNTVRLTAIMPAQDLSRIENSTNLFCNVCLITEEVVETMFLGQARFDVSLGGEDGPGIPVDQSTSNAIALRRNRFIMVEVKDYTNLDFAIQASSYGRIIMNLLGNALKFTESGFILIQLHAEAAEDSKMLLILRMSDSGIGISKDFLFNDAFEPFTKRNPHSAGTGVGLSVVKRVIEDIGGSIQIKSELDRGTEIEVRLTLNKHRRIEDSDSQHSAIAVALSDLKNRKICLLHSKSPEADGPPQHLRNYEILKRYINTLLSTLQDELKMNVTLSDEWDGHDDSDIVICPEVSFDSLQKIRNRTHRKPPATLFIAMDTMEADTLRCDARVTASASVVEVVTQPCGPYKLGIVLSKCLRRCDGTEAENLKDEKGSPTLSAKVNGSQMASQQGPSLGVFNPLPRRPKKRDSSAGQIAPPVALTSSSPPPPPPTGTPSPSSLPPQKSPQVLIVDDNAINRRLLSAFMKKQSLPFAEAHNGLHGLETFRAAVPGTFAVILMDISMPVMDGMTSTRMIREHEKKMKVEATHIIALTGLTSANAKLEAWTSGVDDFLTKPVDFGELRRVMGKGRGAEGTGFLEV